MSPPNGKAFPWHRLLLALGLGTLGGMLFAYLRLPLPWMMGAMVVNTVAAVAGAPVALHQGLRRVMIAVLGVMLGSAFSPDILERADQWLVSLAALFLFVIIATAAVLVFLRRVGGYGPVTAYFAAAPGGLNEMILAGGAMGGDDRTISLIHSIRILLVVMTVPFWFRFAYGYEPGVAPAGSGMADLAWVDGVLLAAAAIGGTLLGGRLRIPAANLTGPLLVSAGIHLAGLTRALPPWELVVAAQVVTGAAIGARFAGVPVRRVMSTLVTGAGATVVMLGVTIVFALGLEKLTGLPYVVILLAFAPGGLAEMCLISLALNADTAFVSTHHLVRIVLVVIFAPVAFRIMRRWIPIAEAKADRQTAD